MGKSRFSERGFLIALGVLGVFIFIGLIIVLWAIGTYNMMVAMNENVKQAWGQVENTYQRRSDLIPNLVEVVKGYATHERETFTAVTEARSKANQTKIDPSNMDAAALQAFQANQGALTSALSRLMVVVEKYPELKANENFKELQAELAGTENRIAVERRKFNLAAQTYNTKLRVFPSSLIASFGGFQARPYFESDKGAEKAPKVKF
jgi:LemA protein